MPENKNTEYKREYIDDIRKTIIAFANTDGGTLYIGVNDDGSVCGVADTDDTMLRITNMLRDAIKPDVSMFVDVDVRTMEEKPVVAVTVQRGTARPYYIAGKGIRPEGVYIRQGASNAPATETAILAMIRETAGDHYEDARSLDQQLTFNQAEEYFRKKNITFGEQEKRTLKLIGEDHTYTNLALLLSDQCSHTIKLAVFDGTTKSDFKDRKEFTGSLLKQLEDAFEYIDQFNHTRSEIRGLDRIDNRDYPPEAIREALLNAVVHREYAFFSSTMISIFSDRMELITTGGLVRGITKDDILLGVSVLRNRNLADVFYRLHLIEAYGIGLPKIRECYTGFPVQPKIEVTDNAFKITLPNKNNSALPEAAYANLKKREAEVIRLFDTQKTITRSIVQEQIGCSQTTAINILRDLVEKGLLVRLHGGMNTVYYKK